MFRDLERFGEKVAGRAYLSMARDAEERKPILEQFDAYGLRVDEIRTTEGWRFFKREAAVERLIALPYGQAASSMSRIH